MSQNTADCDSPAQLAALEEPAISHHLNSSLLLAMAVACGVFVANIYYNQPILELLQQAFRRSSGLINLVPMVTQLGFACGLFFLAPVGERIDLRKLILGHAAVLIVVWGAFASATRRHKLQLAHTASLMQVTCIQKNLPRIRVAAVGLRTLNCFPASMGFGGRNTLEMD